MGDDIRDKRRRVPAQWANLIGLIIAAASLVLTTLFAWLALRETRLARQEQSQYFAAEKPPRITLKSVEYDGRTMKLILQNQGESAAFGVHMTLFIHGKLDPRRGPDATALAGVKIIDNVPPGQRMVHRGETWVVNTEFIRPRIFPIEPRSFEVTEVPKDDYLSLAVTYHDLVGTVHSTSLCALLLP